MRWQPPERWHVTLAFLGEADLDAVAQVLATVAIPDQPVRVRLVGAGTFRSRGGGVLWVGVHGDHLAALAATIRAAVLPDVDEPFRGHVTLARWRGAPAPALAGREALREYAGPCWIAPSYLLVRAHLGRTPRYETVAEFGLTD